MESKKLSEEELKGLESKIFAEPLAAQDVAGILITVREKYLAENTPQLNGRSALWDYATDINQYFKSTLLRPTGFSCYSKEQVSIDNLSLNLMELLFLRETPKNKEQEDKPQSWITIVREKISKLKPKKRMSLANVFENELEKTARYQELKTTKYKVLFDQLENYDFESAHITYEKPPKIDVKVADYLVFAHIISTIPEYLTAKISKITITYKIEKFG